MSSAPPIPAQDSALGLNSLRQKLRVSGLEKLTGIRSIGWNLEAFYCRLQTAQLNEKRYDRVVLHRYAT